jgi:hypothetical protein
LVQPRHQRYSRGKNGTGTDNVLLGTLHNLAQGSSYYKLSVKIPLHLKRTIFDSIILIQSTVVSARYATHRPFGMKKLGP